MSEAFRPLLRELFIKAERRYRTMESESAKTTNVAEGDDLITVIDKEMTDVITSHLADSEYQFAVESEEISKDTGERAVTERNYTAIFDEIDGTAKMARDIGSYGPIVAIADTTDPRFKDVVAAAHLNLRNNEYYEAFQNQGAFRTDSFPNDTAQIRTSGRTTLEGDSLIELLLDQPMLGKVPEVADRAWQYPCNDFGVAGRHYSWIADGTKDGYITGGRGHMPNKPVNTAEELAGMYLIVQEAGGEVTDWRGESIANERIGLLDGKNHDIIAAATDKLAEEISAEIIPADYR